MTVGGAERYQEIANRGGWPRLPQGTRLALGAKGHAVLLLRERLHAEGDVGDDMVGQPDFDKPLAEAVKLFQARHGLARSGIVAGSTLVALNVTAEVRARQLNQSAARLSERAFAFGERYVVVNIPSASVETIENSFVKRRYVAVVGKPENPSPLVETRIGAVNINPTWTLPVSIVRNEIIPKMRKDLGYLSRSRIRLLDGRGGEISPSDINWSTNQALNYTLRQDSGVANALGQLRIDMPNRDSVYMHDTPSKRFFASQDRFYSHGCVRVQDVRSFAAWLLEESPGNWEKSTIDAAIAVGERKDVRLTKPVPVAWVYMTGYVTADGKAHFRDDVYGLDSGNKVVARSNPSRPATNPARDALPSAQSIDPTPTGSIQPRRSWFW